MWDITLLIYTLFLCQSGVVATSSDQRAWQVVSQRAPIFSNAISKWAPNIRAFLEGPSDTPFTFFAPINGGCTIDKHVGEEEQVRGEAIISYHLASGLISITGNPDLLQTALMDSSTSAGNAPLIYLPEGRRQVLKLYREGMQDKVFDGELPPATILQVIPCIDGIVVLIDRTLFPPITVPMSIKDSTPAEAVLQSLLQFGMADFRTPMTLLLPGSSELSEAFKNPQIAAAHACPGIYYSSDLHPGLELRTLTGNRIIITDDGLHYYANGIRLLFYDVPTSFGVVHILERDLAKMDAKISGAWQDDSIKSFREYAVRPQPTTSVMQYSTATCLMVAGAVALCIAIGYIVWRKSQY